MRLFEFDRIGGVASTGFNIHRFPQKFAKAMTAFYLMNNAETGFDPSISVDERGSKYINIEKGGQRMRLQLHHDPLATTRAIASRGTTVWKASLESTEGTTTLVVKDSWQYVGRQHEGELLARLMNAENVVEYFHHESVHIGSDEDSTRLIRRALRDDKGHVFSIDVPQDKQGFPQPPLTDESAPPPRKRKRQESAMEEDESEELVGYDVPVKDTYRFPVSHRVHHRLILKDVGKRLTEASSLANLLRALADAMNGTSTERKFTYPILYNIPCCQYIEYIAYLLY
jgi:hypothetical protein